jgi:hypothetical protein
MARSRVTAPVRWWIVAPVLALAAFFGPVPDWAVDEFYSRDLYPWLQSGLTAASNQTSFAVLDALIGLLVLLALYRVIRLSIQTFTRGPLTAMWEGVRRSIRAAGVLILLFFVTWGCNYQRRPLEQTLATGAATPNVAMLERAVVDANSLAARLRPSIVQTYDMPYEQIAEELREPMNRALEELGRTPLRRAGRPKASRILTPFFTWAGVNGMINPYALESIVHPELTPAERPFVLAHEWAHLAGHGDEAEASAIGWLACMNGGPVLAYSASVYLIMEAAGALPGAEQRLVMARLDGGVREDLARIAERVRQQKPEVQQAASRVYDEYLRANRVEEGTASYTRALSFVLSPTFREALVGYRGSGR